MSSVEIRDAVIDDLPELRAVFRRASWATEGDRPLLELHPEFLVLSGVAVGEGRSRVASVDGRTVGFSSILADGDSVELEDLFVDPDWMRRGVGRALVTDVVDLARTAGLLRIVVDANEHALVFYERVGFLPCGTVKLDHGTAIRMTLQVGVQPLRS